MRFDRSRGSGCGSGHWGRRSRGLGIPSTGGCEEQEADPEDGEWPTCNGVSWAGSSACLHGLAASDEAANSPRREAFVHVNHSRPLCRMQTRVSALPLHRGGRPRATLCPAVRPPSRHRPLASEQVPDERPGGQRWWQLARELHHSPCSARHRTAGADEAPAGAEWTTGSLSPRGPNAHAACSRGEAEQADLPPEGRSASVRIVGGLQ